MPLKVDVMDIFFWILIATIINSCVGLIGIFFFLLKEQRLKKISVYLMAFSAGALLGGAFFHLLPEALEEVPVIHVFTFAVLGFIIFQILEVYLHWHLCKSCDVHPYSYIMTIGDALHNIIDGMVIAASFIVSIPLGIITTIVIILHEVPQEIGIFGAIIHGGQKKETALLYSFIAQTTCILGGIIGFYFSQINTLFSVFLIPFAAGGFIYIVAADLIPEMHKLDNSQKLKTFIIYISGLVMMIAFKFYLE